MDRLILRRVHRLAAVRHRNGRFAAMNGSGLALSPGEGASHYLRISAARPWARQTRS
jgi:hypothetical protein